MYDKEALNIEIGSVVNILVTAILVIVSAYFHHLTSGFEDDIKGLNEKVEELIKRCYSYHGQGREKEKDG